MQNHIHKINDGAYWLIGQIFTTGMLAFSMDLFKAFMLGLVGGLGGLLVKVIYNKFIK